MIRIYESTAFSFPKKKDKENQDFILPPKRIGNGFLFGVADGVGSYLGAELASRTAIHFLETLEGAVNIEDMKDIFFKIRKNISALSEIDLDFTNSATTLTFCYLDVNGLKIGHVGDCRLYFKKDNKLHQLTKDHTHYEYLKENNLSLKDKKEIEKAKSIINNAISQNIVMKIENYDIPINQLDEDGAFSLFLMSDGAYHYWDKNKRFSENTMNSVVKFSNSLLRRIERNIPIDDYSFVGVSFKR